MLWLKSGSVWVPALAKADGSQVVVAYGEEEGSSTPQPLLIDVDGLLKVSVELAAAILAITGAGASTLDDIIAALGTLDTGLEAVETAVAAVESAVELLRWGDPLEPAWVDGAIATAPAAGADLVTKTVTAGKTGQVYGISIAADEANTFDLCKDDTPALHFAMAGAGTIFILAPKPILADVAASVELEVKNITIGTAAKKYQARLLYKEA